MFKISTNLIKCPISAVNPARRQNIKINNILLQIFWLCLLIHLFYLNFKLWLKLIWNFLLNQFIILIEFHIYFFFYQNYEKLVYLKTQNSPRDNGKQLTDSVVTIPMSIAWRVSEILCVIICHRESAKYLYSCYIFTK